MASRLKVLVKFSRQTAASLLVTAVLSVSTLSSLKVGSMAAWVTFCGRAASRRL